MSLQVLKTENPGTIRLIGEVDVSNVHALRDALRDEIQDGAHVTLDLAGLAFLDSTGIQLIVRTARELQGRGTLTLRSPGDLVRRTLELVPVERLGNVHIVEGDGP
jgi:anti-anti-sigma factor